MACKTHLIFFWLIWNLLYENGNLKTNFSKKVLYNPLMGCSPFPNCHFQMGVTAMGFAEHFGPRVLKMIPVLKSVCQFYMDF